ncbi:MAG: DEAD/DEAH box helicase family protein [Clostridiales bacterium]|nr:DEAD/DEAH box helicase family protein [Clostridiales bacterium]
MTNFDFLKNEKDFSVFADVAIKAEEIFHIDAEASVLNCRRAMEFAVKWMYSVDAGLKAPAYDDSLNTLMGTEEFRNIVEPSLLNRMHFIRKIGNLVAHGGKKIAEAQARLCLENLFYFLDFVAYCYAEDYEEKQYDGTLADKQTETLPDYSVAINFAELLAENASLQEELTRRREVQEKTYAPKKNPSEYETRKLYIDVALSDAGWIENKNWVNEYELVGMPNASGVGYADYVLFSDDGKPLAVVEAKKTCVDIVVGRQQARLYADLLEKQFGRRPIIFLSNGYDTRIWDDKYYPERRVSGIYSKRDLERLFNLRMQKTSLKQVTVNKGIAGRYYQEAAIKSICEALDERNRRKALLVMATGSGKTRTVIGLVDVLLRHGWIKNVLFLADRTALVTQAKRAFVNLLPDFSVANLCESKNDPLACGIFSTYQTMMNCIDNVKDDEGRLFTCGHFDLIVCDEAHRSIYNKYQSIFEYFDAPLVGLTATPKDDIDKNTYDIFELEQGVPTYGYDLAQAVSDGFLVDYVTADVALKFMQQGVVYSELSPQEKEEYENTFADENGEYPESISSKALNEWLFNEDTIVQALRCVMNNALKIDYGSKIGKTIIFAKNHKHAELIFEIFNREYPHLNGYAKVIDNYLNYSQSAIDEFADAKKMPQIAISVDMLDTGIDIPEILNLVIFKPVLSSAKFWQIIGRGTRLCPELLDGENKQKFFVFDFCGVCEFFKANKGKEVNNQVALQSAIFNLKAQIVYKLQDIEYQTEDLISFRNRLINELKDGIAALNKNNFAVKLHLKYVEEYAIDEAYAPLSYEDTLIMAEHIAPLILPEKDDVAAVRFDSLMYAIELAYLAGKTYNRARTDLLKKVAALSQIANIPQIMMHTELIESVLNPAYLETAGINEFERIRENLRDLMKFIPKSKIAYKTNFTDEILSIEWKDAELNSDALKNYKIKAESYVREHQDIEAIAKLKRNEPLTTSDIAALEEILWNDLGTKEDYESSFGAKPLGEFVREIVGLDMASAKAAFAVYLNENQFDSRQIYFVNQIIEYIVKNGLMKDLSVLQSAPFTDKGSIIDVFRDVNVWYEIRKIITTINSNAIAA